MSSRVLRKLQGEKEKDLIDEVSDTETDTSGIISNSAGSGGGARRKQLNINRYDLLNQQSHSESEVKEDDNETEAAKSCEGGTPIHENAKRKKKKKKKKSGKHSSTQRSSEDNADIDEVERSVREVNRLLGETQTIKLAAPCENRSEKTIKGKDILFIQTRHLNPNNELKRIFGSKIIQTEHKRKNRSSGCGGRGSSHLRSTFMVSCKENWPPVSKCGLSMNLIETKNGFQYFSYEHSHNYRQVQMKFLEAVETLNPDNIIAIINEHPYHLDAIIQLSELCKLSEDLPMAAELIERALYCLEYAYHPLFNPTHGNCRLDYRRQENRAFYIVIFKHLTFVAGRACCRTALEYCKLLLRIDPDADPLAIKLVIDYYALRAREYQWLIDFVNEWDATRNLLQLPNFNYSLAVAYFYVGDTVKANDILQTALLKFPTLLKLLLEKCAVQVDNRVASHEFFNVDKKLPAALKQLINLYVNRCYHIWKDSDLLPWLESNVHEVLDRVDCTDSLVEEFENQNAIRYKGYLPLSISRHIILSDIKGVAPLIEDNPGSVLFFDPLPPPDSINIYTKPKKSTMINSNSNPLSTFFQSLLPNFEGDLILDPRQRLEDVGAEALPADFQVDTDFRRSVASLVDAMRELLNNIRPVMPNDADVDENDDSEIGRAHV